MENLALNNILTRSSVRTYLPDRQIQENDIELILKAGMAAPLPSTASRGSLW